MLNVFQPGENFKVDFECQNITRSGDAIEGVNSVTISSDDVTTSSYSFSGNILQCDVDIASDIDTTDQPISVKIEFDLLTTYNDSIKEVFYIVVYDY